MNEKANSLRYMRNQQAISALEQERLAAASVLVIGCGGLGGFIIEEISRVGVGIITVWDGDSFEESNLNRQLLSLSTNLGTKKAEAAAERIKAINPGARVETITRFFQGTPEDIAVIARHQVVIEALDTISARLTLNECCQQAKVTLVHGAVGGWWGQVAVIAPGDRTLETIYRETALNQGCEEQLGCPVMTVAVVASLQVTEAVKVLLGRPHLGRGQLLLVDLQQLELQIAEIPPLLDTSGPGQ